MVATVARKGFAATTVADLVELSGVSSRSFYDFFGDKATCLRATIEEILTVARNLVNVEVGEDLEQGALRGYKALAEAVVAQPAAAKVCLVDAYAAGPAAVEPLTAAVADYEAGLSRRLKSLPERAGMPAEMVAARVGGYLEIVRTRLRRGSEAELLRLGDDLISLILADRPPPVPLRLSVRPPKAEPESLAAPEHAERAIRAFAILAAEQGYLVTTVDDVLKRASMSATTFYANFRGKNDLMDTAIDRACAQAVAAVVPAFSRHGDWPDAVRAGFGALMNFLASRPALTELVTVEVYTAGDAAVERRMNGLAPLGYLLVNNTVSWMKMPPVVYESLGGGINTLLYDTVRKSGPRALPSLAPILTYLTLSPFIGAEAACEAANGDGSGRASSRSEVSRWNATAGAGAIPFRAPTRPTFVAALLFLEKRSATPSQVAAEIGDHPAVVSAYLKDLASIGAVEAKGEEHGEVLYRSPSAIHKLSMVSSQQAATMSPEERSDLSRRAWEAIAKDVDDSRQSGIFDSRLDRYLTRTPLALDETGWRELTDLHEEMLHAGIEIQARSTQRLKDTKEKPIEVRSVQLAFEAKPAEDPSEGEN
jgi:AcrR family transcriptional regulator